MNTTIEYLDALKTKLGGLSDYAMAPILGITKSQVSLYRNGKQFFSDEMCLKVALLLEIEPFPVIASIHAERAKTDTEKALWKGMFEKLGGTAAMVALGIMLNVISPTPANASEGSSDLQSRSERDLSIHYAKL